MERNTDNTTYIINNSNEYLTVEDGTIIFEKDMRFISLLDTVGATIFSLFRSPLTIVQAEERIKQIYDYVVDNEFLDFIEELKNKSIIIPLVNQDR